MTKQSTVKLKTPRTDPVELPAVLTIAGSDSSGGAGIEADLKTLSAHNVYGLTCIAALTAQNTQKVKTFEKTSEELVAAILEMNFNDFLYGYEEGKAPLKVIKTGMLTEEAIRVLSGYTNDLNKYDVKVVIDPVMISTSGSQLFDDRGLKLCMDSLIGKSYLVTPNFGEAHALYEIANGRKYDLDIKSKEDLINFVKDVQRSLGCANLLVKGGHLPWDLESDSPAQGITSSTIIFDILYRSKEDSITIFQSAFIDSQDSHGTGCTLSSAIAANLANGKSLDQSVPLAIDFIHRGMTSLKRKLGFGNGPLNHNVKPEQHIDSIIDFQLESSFPKNTNALDFLKNHPKVAANWKKYTEHPFVKLLAENKLPFEKFLYFLKQDYYYLINYAQIHGLAASAAPTYKQTHSEALIIGNIVEEIERHKIKLCNKYNIDYERDIDLDIELSPGKACTEYCDFLLKTGKEEDYFGIKIALAPCLFGYFEAGQYGSRIRTGATNNAEVTPEQSEVYQSWLNDYTSDWYSNAYNEGNDALQELFNTIPLTQERLDQFAEVFNKVTCLEVAFWDECMPEGEWTES
ncbi:uncharacterized protein CANTADRAFT_43483 [Suhomyces tanzawaensis NRRL Y-17324]|uniref:Phosphomethylpyrimidine kinase n=1 Tax=Suhomyces tanzawaensis NRRL Y-17324 TaxID=984487 RepID=A0A1E4SQH9_9ASCO|nr:uncharacterized protein CANTADRAFT_43483 [Suhomyces tanzawaensis NRRL Y-17324]ODV81766.1 hypothetical protein CANTADRAFT_43483 [Suhomyces tanzawaensis NRRL Y-17324]